MKSVQSIEKEETERKALQFLAGQNCGAAMMSRHLFGSTTSNNCEKARKMLNKFVHSGWATMREGLYAITDLGRSI